MTGKINEQQQRIKLAFHDADTDTDILADILARIVARTVSYTHLTLPTILRV